LPLVINFNPDDSRFDNTYLTSSPSICRIKRRKPDSDIESADTELVYQKRSLTPRAKWSLRKIHEALLPRRCSEAQGKVFQKTLDNNKEQENTVKAKRRRRLMCQNRSVVLLTS